MRSTQSYILYDRRNHAGSNTAQRIYPLDDDIDLGMPRKDYEKLLMIAPKELPEHLKVVNYRNTPHYQYYITRILDTHTKVIEERIGNSSRYTHVSIDIFPIDGTPNNRFLRKFYFLRVLFHRALMSYVIKIPLIANVTEVQWKKFSFGLWNAYQ